MVPGYLSDKFFLELKKIIKNSIDVIQLSDFRDFLTKVLLKKFLHLFD